MTCKVEMIDKKDPLSHVKVDVIPNEFEKYMAFTINKNFFFVESKQFMSSSFEKLVKRLPHGNFKHLTQECGSESLKLLKHKNVYPYEYLDSFERFSKNEIT